MSSKKKTHQKIDAFLINYFSIKILSKEPSVNIVSVGKQYQGN